MELVGDVSDKNIIIVDDMADTLGTMKKAADSIDRKSPLSVIGVATHGILSGKALENLNTSKMSKFLVSNSISEKPTTTLDKLEYVSCNKLIQVLLWL
jgi:ribose-phosphate pyrophosphokinase